MANEELKYIIGGYFYDSIEEVYFRIYGTDFYEGDHYFMIDPEAINNSDHSFYLVKPAFDSPFLGLSFDDYKLGERIGTIFQISEEEYRVGLIQ
jgi:hypothetical protein